MKKITNQFGDKLLLILPLLLLSSCGGSSSGGSDDAAVSAVTPADNATVMEVQTPDNTPLDDRLRQLISDQNLSGDPSSNRTLPDISDPLPQLGKLLFFSQSLGGGFDSACVTCHHPLLGGGDDLSLSVGVDAVQANLLGEGRVHTGGEPLVPRNAPTVFNTGLWDSGLFWDSRVESLGKESGLNGAGSPIRTPDSNFAVADANAGLTLTAAQARFPVTSNEEMKTAAFENGSDNATTRSHLAARVGDYGIGSNELPPNTWSNQFQQAFDSTDTPQSLITFDNIAQALSEYERSMVFIDNPWKAYVEGDNSALSEEQKQGAVLFLADNNDDGAGCSHCHKGDLFSDGSHQIVSFPQIGIGKGDGNNDDFGRERESGDAADRYRFRVPSLLNVEVTAPYGHAGAYDSLREVVRHYDNPQDTVENFFADGGWCQLNQFQGINNCATLYPDAENNSNRSLNKLQAERDAGTALFENINLNNNERDQIVAFLRALTDPCVENRDCLAPWIPDNTQTGPDGQQLNGVDRFNQPL